MSAYGTFCDRQELKPLHKVDVNMEEQQNSSNRNDHRMVGTLQLAVIVFYTVAGTFQQARH